MLIQSHKIVPGPIPFEIIPISNYGFSQTISQYKSLVLHYTAANTPEDTINWFKNPASQVSAHLLIARDGRIWQFVPFNKPAYHSGNYPVNLTSIGIELDNIGYERDSFTVDPANAIRLLGKDGVERSWEVYPAAQYDALVAVSRLLVKTYGILEIVGHDKISDEKLDPGPAFPMEKFKIDVPVYVPSPQPAGQEYIATSNLNVRNGAGSTYPLLGILYKGAVIRVTNTTPTNGYLGYEALVSGTGPKSGWVYAAYLAAK